MLGRLLLLIAWTIVIFVIALVLVTMDDGEPLPLIVLIVLIALTYPISWIIFNDANLIMRTIITYLLY